MPQLIIDTDELAIGAGSLLGRAFFDDPALCWVFSAPETRAVAVHLLESTFVRMYRPLGTGLASLEGGTLCAASLWLPPDRGFGWLDYVRNGLLTLPFRIGPGPLRRLLIIDARIHAIRQAHGPTQPYWYLDTLGVDPDHQGRGHGSRHLAEALATRVDPAGAPAMLFTSNPRNVLFYERAGFEVRADEQVGGPEGFRLWFLTREPR